MEQDVKIKLNFLVLKNLFIKKNFLCVCINERCWGSNKIAVYHMSLCIFTKDFILTSDVVLVGRCLVFFSVSSTLEAQVFVTKQELKSSEEVLPGRKRARELEPQSKQTDEHCCLYRCCMTCMQKLVSIRGL